MSTNTKTQVTSPFDAGEVDKLPQLACIGVVDTDLPEGKESDSQKYYMQQIKLKGVAGSRSTGINFLYRPEQLVPGFQKSAYDEIDPKVAKGILFVYHKNIVGKGYNVKKDQEGTAQLSVLAGLAGSAEGYVELATALNALPFKNEAGNWDVRFADVRDTFRKYFRENETQKIGYILKQKTEKVATGELDENGNERYEYVRVEGYEVGDWFRVSAKAVKALKARAAKNPEFRVGFDSEIPF